MSILSQLIQDTENTNNQIRQAAENHLLEARNHNPSLFVLGCSEEFKNNELSSFLRPKAGILVKFTLINNANGPDALWKSFSPDIQQQIKANLLEVTEPNDIIRNVAADLISIIYVIELAWNGWPTLFPFLVQNMNSNDEDLKKLSIMVLEKICDQAKVRKISLNQDTVNLILLVLIQFIRDNPTNDTLKTSVLRTIDSSLTFFKEIFETQSVIRGEFLTFLLKEARSENQNIKIKAIQCLLQFVTIAIHYLKECWQNIWEATSTQITNNTTEIAIMAIELWQTVIQQDKQRILHNEVSQRLVPALFENLLDEQKSREDEEMSQYGELSIFAATKTCLTSLAQVINETPFVAFIQKYLWNENLIEKRASLVVYSCMLESPKPQSLATFITQALPAIADILFNSENNDILKQDASLAFQRTFAVLPELFSHGDLLNSRLQDLTNAIKAPIGIAINMATFWKNLGQFIADNNKDFSLDFSQAIGNLVENIFRELDYQDYPLIEQSLLAAGALISCLSQELKIEYINSLREKIKEQDQERIQFTQVCFLSCIKIVVEKCQLTSEDAFVKDIFSLLDEISEALGRIPDEGINVLQSLISVLGPDSTAICFEKIWIRIMRGFSFTEDPHGFIASLKAILKMAQTCPGQVKSALDDILKSLVTVINNPGYAGEYVRAEIIEFIGDLVGVFKDEILNHIQSITDIYNAGIELFTRNPAPNGALGAEKLKENLVKSYRNFFKVVTQSASPDLMLNRVPNMMQYLMVTCSKNWNPTMDYIRDALDLVFEIALKFKDKGIENVKSEVVVSLVEKLAQFPDDPRNREIIASAKEVFNYL